MKAQEIIQQSYDKQNEATEKLHEVYDCGKNLTEAQRNEVLHAINGQKQAALSLHKVLQSLK